MKTLIENLKHSVKIRETLFIGGGVFTPVEIAEAVISHEALIMHSLQLVYSCETGNEEEIAQSITRLMQTIGKN